MSIHTDADSVNINIFDYLPPLAVLIDSALTNSPLLKYADSKIESASYAIILEKKDWAKDIRFTSGYNIISGYQFSSTGQLVQSSTTRTDGYNVGAGVTIPLSTIIGRGDRIKKAEAERLGVEAEYNQIVREVKEEVIETYNQLLLLQRLLVITAEARESARIISDMSEDKFRDGTITIEDLGKSTELQAKYSTEYEIQRTDFNNMYAKLQRIVGVPFSKFESVR